MVGNPRIKLAYKRAMLHKAAELAQEYGGLGKIPADVLLENGIGIVKKGRALTVSVDFPEPALMEKRIAQGPTPQGIAREVEKFKLSPEPKPRALPKSAATMEDFWIEQGWYRIERSGWRLLLGKWAENDELKRKAVRFLANEVLGRDPRTLSADDFRENMLRGLINGQYSNSPYAAVADAFPELEIKPWEMNTAPQGFYSIKENRVAAIRWAVKKIGKDPRRVNQTDLDIVRGAMPYYDGSPYEAVSEAFPELGIMPWEMKNTPTSFFESKERRVEAVRWLVDKLGVEPCDLKYGHFCRRGLYGLVHRHYSSSPYKAVCEAYPELGIKQWEMSTTPHNFYDKKKNRVAAVLWLKEKLGKEPRDIVGADFENNRLCGLFTDYYGSSPYQALLEAGLVTADDEGYMRKSGPRK